MKAGADRGDTEDDPGQDGRACSSLNNQQKSKHDAGLQTDLAKHGRIEYSGACHASKPVGLNAVLLQIHG